MDKQMKDMKKYLKKHLTKDRYQHTLGVAYTAMALAMKYNPDTSNNEFVEKARIAGMLHDCAKCMSDSKRIEICDKHNIVYTDFEHDNGFLLHGRVGAYIAESKFDIHDVDILNAISWHTTGHPGMSMLEKIIFVADYIEPGRRPIPELDLIRQMAFDDIDKAMEKILYNTLNYLGKNDNPVDPMTRQTFDFMIGEHKHE